VAAIGFVGLGTMGRAMVRRLLATGHGVRGWNRTAEKASPLVELGMTLASSPREAARDAELVFTMVSDDEALTAVALGEGGVLAGLGSGAVWVDTSTVSPGVSRRLGALARERGAWRVEAPVSGSWMRVASGDLTVYAAGEEEGVRRALPTLKDLGRTVITVGALGEALTLKLAINANMAVQMLTFAESVAWLERLGLERARTVPWMLESVVASPMLRYRGPYLLEPPAEVSFDVDLTAKDVRLARDLAASCGAPAPALAMAAEVLETARRLGLGKRELAEVVAVYREREGER
jgi:3-hydroxyisobutyrate dehydrogenase-like beta-hydroxyacid dehydrogenase